MLKVASRYWHTLRHLRPAQVLGRVRLRLLRPRFRPGLPLAARAPTGVWATPIAGMSSMTGPAAFRFLNAEASLPAMGGWETASPDKLWLYNLHYFDDLNAVAADTRRAWHDQLILRWIAENPPAQGTGWESYPTSLRIVNWIKWLLTGNTPPAGMLESLADQARWLRRRIEWHLLGNHLFVNAKALILTGLFFDGAEPDEWVRTGSMIVAREIGEQVLPDGGNFERSPMYHAIFLEDVLDLINAATAWPGRCPAVVEPALRDRVAPMLRWLDGMTHPDGEIALFNDAAFDIAPSLQDLRNYARSLGVITHTAHDVDANAPFELFADSGYARVSVGAATAIMDFGLVGPDYLPGHAHADTLSFELSVGTDRVIMNGGTSRYGTGPERQRERGTAAHSTVVVDGQDSSEVWSGFRVARRARPFGLTVKEDGARIELACSHDGYSRLPGRPVHRRAWALTDQALEVQDTVTGGTHQAVARFILHPTVQVVDVTATAAKLVTGSGHVLELVVGDGTLALGVSHYAPKFGISRQTASLDLLLVEGKSMITFKWNSPADA